LDTQGDDYFFSGQVKEWTSEQGCETTKKTTPAVLFSGLRVKPAMTLLPSPVVEFVETWRGAGVRKNNHVHQLIRRILSIVEI
jgi:hypothetical protein